MLVDHERVLLALKRHIASKPHHGQRELAVLIAGLEADNQIEEGLPERALRLYGLEFFEEVVREARTPPSQRGSVPDADGDQDRALRGDSSLESEEDTHVRSGRGRRTGRSPTTARRYTPSRSGSNGAVTAR